ncbi:MAG: hypothetical protein ACOYK8_09125 [Alphaproteobacteria bacterium]
MNQAELESKCQAIYDEAADFSYRYGDVVTHGLNILLGRPIAQAKLMIVSFQGTGDDLGLDEHTGKPRRTWPEELLYMNEDYPCGDILFQKMQKFGLRDVLLDETVAAHVVFPQSPEAENRPWKGEYKTDPDSPYAQWKNFSREKCRELILMVQPSALLVLGREAEKGLNIGKHDPHYGEFELEGIKGIYSHQLSKGWTHEGLDRCFSAVKGLIPH